MFAPIRSSRNLKSGVPLTPGPDGHRLVAYNKFFGGALEAVRKSTLGSPRRGYSKASWEDSGKFFQAAYVIDWKNIFLLVTRLTIHYHISVSFQMIKT